MISSTGTTHLSSVGGTTRLAPRLAGAPLSPAPSDSFIGSSSSSDDFFAMPCLGTRTYHHSRQRFVCLEDMSPSHVHLLALPSLDEYPMDRCPSPVHSALPMMPVENDERPLPVRLVPRFQGCSDQL